MENVVFGFLGSKLDAGMSERRLARWRPTVALCAHAHFPVNRLELLLHSEADQPLAERVISDLSVVSPQTRVCTQVLKDVNPWNFEDIFGALHDIARAYPFSENERYYIHLTTGSHVAQICLFLLAESRRIPALLVETAMTGRLRTPGGASSTLSTSTFQPMTGWPVASHVSKKSQKTF